MRLALTVGVALVALSAWANSATAQKGAPAEGTHSGSFVSATAGKLVMTDKDNKEHSHTIAKEAKFTLDGKTVALEAFKKGMAIKVTTDKSGAATAIAGETAKPPAAKGGPVKSSARARTKTAPKAPASGSGK